MGKSKVLTILLAFCVAIGLWLYVVTNVNTETDETYANIPVVLENEATFRDKGLMLLSGQDATVTLKIYASRAVLNKLSRDNITVTADLGRISEAGTYALQCSVSYPDEIYPPDVTITERNPQKITVEVAVFAQKEIPVQLEYTGEMEDDLILDRENAKLEPASVTISGPEEMVEQIDHAGITIDRNGLTASIDEDYRVTLEDASGAPVEDVSTITANVDTVHVVLPVEKYKEVPVKLKIINGGGATEETIDLNLKPETIAVSGSQESLDALDEIVLGEIRLGDYSKAVVLNFDVVLPSNVTNRSGVTKVRVALGFSQLIRKTFSITKFQAVNLPEGMEATILTQALEVTIRGPRDAMKDMKAEDIVVTVDYQGQDPGTVTVPARVTVPGNDAVGAPGEYSVSVRLVDKSDESDPVPEA